MILGNGSFLESKRLFPGVQTRRASRFATQRPTKKRLDHSQAQKGFRLRISLPKEQIEGGFRVTESPLPSSPKDTIERESSSLSLAEERVEESKKSLL